MVVETQALGVPMADAVQRIYERMPCSEANFFGIVIAIQAKAGGNLSEALGNLSKVLRERKKMRAKIKAVSMEAKASAGIIGILPIAVMTLVYLSTPHLHRDSLDHQSRLLDARRLRLLDDLRRAGHEEDDQLRLLAQEPTL